MHFVLARPLAVLIALLPALLNAYLAFYISRKMSRSTLTDLFMFFLLSLLSWQLFDIMLRLSADLPTAVLVDKIFCHGWILSAPLGVHFAITYKDQRKKLNALVAFFLYLPAILFVALYESFTGTADFKLLHFWGWVNSREGSVFETVLVIWYVTYVGITLYFFISKFRSTAKGTTARRQSLLILCAYAIPSVQGVITQAVFPSRSGWTLCLLLPLS